MAKKKSVKKNVVEVVFDVDAIMLEDLASLQEAILASCVTEAEEKVVSGLISLVASVQTKVMNLHESLRVRLPKCSDRILKLRAKDATVGVRLAAKKAKLAKLNAEIVAMEESL